MKILYIMLLGAMPFIISSCTKDDPENPEATEETVLTDTVSKAGVRYEASGSILSKNISGGTSETQSYSGVKVQYKDESHLWANTYYTYLTFTNSTPSQTVSFVFLGKTLPKTGTYKIGPWPIAINGIKEQDRLLSDEIAIFDSKQLCSKRNSTITIELVNDNGRITLKSSNEINLYSTLTDGLEGSCANINLIKTVKKL